MSSSYPIGGPGHLGREVQPGPPLAPGSDADVEISEYRVPGAHIRAASTRGLLHRHWANARQDAFSITYHQPTNTVFIAVADGVSAHANSRQAATIAVESAARIWAEGATREGATPLAGVAGSVNTELLGARSQGQDLGLTTLTMVTVAITGDRAAPVEVEWVGDSPVWELHQGAWTQITTHAQAGMEVAIDALPHPQAQFHYANTTVEAGAVFVMTDGVGDAMVGDDVASQLASWWATPPDGFSFGQQVGFVRRTFFDDRTCVGVWVE